MMRLMLVLGIAGAAAVAGPLEAQGRGRGRDGTGVPPGQYPPAGQCRIWIDGVAPGQQRAPTDCATAERDRPANGRVIYGDDVRDARKNGKPVKGKKDKRDKDDRRDRDDDRRDDDRRDRRDDDDRDDARRDRDDDRDRRGRDTCVDRNRDGRCDVRPGTGTGGAGTIGSYPRTLPMMVNTAVLAQGSRSREATIWLRGVPATGRAVDDDGNRIPEQIDWIATDGQVIQKWFDGDRDGRANRVEIFRDGRLVGTRR